MLSSVLLNSVQFSSTQSGSAQFSKFNSVQLNHTSSNYSSFHSCSKDFNSIKMKKRARVTGVKFRKIVSIVKRPLENVLQWNLLTFSKLHLWSLRSPKSAARANPCKRPVEDLRRQGHRGYSGLDFLIFQHIEYRMFKS